MKCCSRSTLGVVIGILNVVIYAVLIIVGCYQLVQLSNLRTENYLQRNEVAKYQTILGIILVFCAVMTLISGLLITGIVKRRHKLMIPWLILSGIGFVCNCGRFLYAFFDAIFSGASISVISIILIAGLLGIGISALILWPIFTLYGDIRRKNVEKPGQVMRGDQIVYKTQDGY